MADAHEESRGRCSIFCNAHGLRLSTPSRVRSATRARRGEPLCSLFLRFRSLMLFRLSHPFFLSLARGRPKVEPKVSHSASCAPRGCSVPDWSQTRRFRLEVRPGLPRRPHASTIPREHPHRARRALANQHGAPLASDGKVHVARGRGSWGAGPSPSVPCRLAPPTRPPLSWQAIRRDPPRHTGQE